MAVKSAKLFLLLVIHKKESTHTEKKWEMQRVVRQCPTSHSAVPPAISALNGFGETMEN